MVITTSLIRVRDLVRDFRHRPGGHLIITLIVKTEWDQGVDESGKCWYIIQGREMVLSIHISSSESGACARMKTAICRTACQSSSSVIFRCTEHHSATPPRQAVPAHQQMPEARQKRGAVSTLFPKACQYDLADLCMSVHRVSHNLSCCFSAYPSCFGISAAMMRSRASSNACVSGPDSGIFTTSMG